MIVTIDDAGHARITVDGVMQSSSDDPDEPIDRRGLGAVLARLADQLGGPVRVEVREADGIRYADILQPHPDGAPRLDDAKSPAHVAVEGEGFLPGEPVLVALVAATVHADDAGTVRLARLRRMPQHVEELILFGLTSGTILHGPAPARPDRRRP